MSKPASQLNTSCRIESREGRTHFFISTKDSDAECQLREVLNRLGDELRPLGLAATDLLSVVCSVSEPARFHPKIRRNELIYREVFGGYGPGFGVEKSDGAISPVSLHAIAAASTKADDPVAWRGYRRSELEIQMSPRSGAPSMENVFQGKRDRSQQFRQAHKMAAYDIAYGSTASETFDLFHPDTSATPPVWVFIHGGYWQASDKADVHDLATKMLESGYAVAMINYNLCPQAPLERVVSDVQRSLHFIHREARSLGIDPDNFHIAGTSAGAHLTALMACDRSLDFVRSALVISGILDLRPVSMVRAGTLLGLNDSTLLSLSPILLRPNANTRIGVAVGELESDEFRRMSDELAQTWAAPKLLVPDKSHFNVTDHLLSGGPLLDFALSVAETSSQTTER